MQPKTTIGFRKRILRALESGPSPMTVRALGNTVRERFPDVRGASYGGVRAYVEGRVRNPRLELLHALADVLAVRFEWLAYGDGEMTPADEKQRERSARRSVAAIARAEGTREWKAALSFVWDVREALIPDSFPDLSPAGYRVDAAGAGAAEDAPAVLAAWARAHNASVIPYWYAPDEEAARRHGISAASLGRALRAPLDVLGIDPALLAEGRALDDYITAMTPVFLTLAARQKPSKTSRKGRD